MHSSLSGGKKDGAAWLGPAIARIFVALIFTASAASGLRAQSATDIGALNKRAAELFRQGKYNEAATLAENTLAFAERTLGKEHPRTL
jgi:hypothetical protein